METHIDVQLKSKNSAIRHHVARTLESLTDDELQEVANYLAFLRYRDRLRAMPQVDKERLVSLYAEFAEEDRELAEEGMTEYLQTLQSEETR